MYQLYVDGIFNGNFSTQEEALVEAKRLTQGFPHMKFEIKDGFGNTSLSGEGIF